MVKRKKRLEKGIKSLEKQINIHKSKKEQAIEEGKIELGVYYTKEIEAKQRDLNKKEHNLKRKRL